MNEKVPHCIGIIMDGNRRWAREQSLPAFEGHRQGLGNFDNVAQWVREAGVRHLAVYALSTENWNRSEEEVSALVELFRSAMNDAFERLAEGGARLHFIGDLSRFPSDVANNMRRLEEETAENSDFHLWVCASYGGRLELVEAVKKLIEAGEEVSEETLRSHLWSADLPDADIIIRTGGEHRISNFLPWQSAYAEFFFPEVYWPAFTQDDLHRILSEYAQRERRYGK